MGGANRWKYESFVNWEFFPSVDLPILVNFTETQTPQDQWDVGPGQGANGADALAKGAVKGQVHADRQTAGQPFSWLALGTPTAQTVCEHTPTCPSPNATRALGQAARGPEPRQRARRRAAARAAHPHVVQVRQGGGDGVRAARRQAGHREERGRLL